MADTKWWKERIVYQIYPMSFCDSNGDGIGDLQGIISKLDYLKKLGVGVLWLSPVYPSPNEDNGYDISDYCGIHPDYGTLEDMDELLRQAHERDIKIILDLVINHTSKAHEWFQKSRQRIEPYTDYYIWKKGKKGKKPSNWTSFFGEDCWEYDELRGEYYLHLFAKGQPDLNYRCPSVVDAVEDVMRFWLDRGVDGFRCDVINILWKNSLDNGKWKPALTGSEHYISTDGLHRLLHRFNEDVLTQYDCYTVGETVFVTPKMADDLVNPARGELNTVFSFEHMETDCYFVKWFLRRFSPDRFFSCLSKWQTSLDWNTVYFENHDQPRSVSRFGDDIHYHDESAKTLATLLLSLRGTAFIFEGQEIGMTNFDFEDMTPVRDVESHNIWALTGRLRLPKALRWRMIKQKSRDNARTPMQWSGEANGGFTTGTPWLSVNSNHKTINVAAQEEDFGSVLNYYRRLIALRNGGSVLKFGSYKELYLKDGVFAFEREYEGESLVTVVNISGSVRITPLVGNCLISTEGRARLEGEMKPYEAAIIRR